MTRSRDRTDLSRFVAAARSDVPSAAELQRALRGVQLRAASGVSLRSAPNRLRLIKPGLLGVALVVAIGAVLASRFAESPPAPTPPVQRQPALIPRAPAEAALESPPQLEAAPERAPDARATKPRPRSSPRAPRSGAEPRPAASSDPTAESALIEAARSALRADPAHALALTAEHARDFPAGILSVEREALAIHALALLGRQQQAARRLEAFRQAHPRSIHVMRLDALLRSTAQ